MAIIISDRDKDHPVFLLNTDHTSYAFCINSSGIVEHLFFGSRVNSPEDFGTVGRGEGMAYHSGCDITPEECSSFGCQRYKETSMKLTFGDGVRDLRLKYRGYRTEGNVLYVELKDTYYDLEVTLIYRVFEHNDIIGKSRTVRNNGKLPVMVESLYSSEFALHGTGYRTLNSNGTWAGEFKMYENRLNGGKTIIESTRNTAAHVATPGFIVYRNASETYGDVWFGVIEYSGSFKICLEQTPYGWLNILAGMSDTDFEVKLENGARLDSPVTYIGYSSDGFDTMSTRLLKFSHDVIMPEPYRGKPLDVLYNSWEATAFDINCEDQMKLAEIAASVGAELFVMDDGWFGKRNNDHAGLGDWYVNREKFPDGLTPLIEKVNSLGMRFGLWFEPEEINPDSELFRSHPDWVCRYNNRPLLLGRNQAVLDLTRGDVRDYIIEALSKMLSENNISYIKWDMNYPVSECASAAVPPDVFKSLHLRQAEGFVEIARELKRRFPQVEFEACASGGGRIDYQTMGIFDEFWTSDNTNGYDRLSIQEGYSYLYPPKYMRAWATDSGHFPVEFNFHIAMCGALGLGMNLHRCNSDKLKLIGTFVRHYKDIRTLVQFGTLHRLAGIKTDGYQAVQYENRDETVAFVFCGMKERGFGMLPARIRLRGLDPDAEYAVLRIGSWQDVADADIEHIDAESIIARGKRLGGAYLMNCGIDVAFHYDMYSCMVRAVKIDRIDTGKGND